MALMTRLALVKSPLLKAGCPQQVWSSGNSTRTNFCKISTAPFAASANIVSQRQVDIKSTTLPRTLFFGGVNIVRILIRVLFLVKKIISPDVFLN